MTRALTEVFGEGMVFLFAGRTKVVEEFLEKDPSGRSARWVKLGASGRIMTVEEFKKEGQ
jgi:hypothetical protein